MTSLSLVVVSAASALSAGCEEESRPAPVSPQTTSASSQDQMSALEQERNQAEAALAQERTAREEETKRCDGFVAEQRERDGLELRVIDALERAGTETETAHEKAGRLNAKQRQTMGEDLGTIRKSKERLLGQLRRLHRGLGTTSWDDFRSEVDGAIRDLDNDVAKVRKAK